MAWKLVRFGGSDFAMLASMWIFYGVYWAHLVRESDSPWVPITLSVGMLGVVCVMVCELAVVRRGSGGVYEKEVSPRSAPPDPALHETSAGEHVVGVLDDMLFLARKEMGATLSEFREDVRGYRYSRQERKERLAQKRMSL